eukprot:6608524-Alexandrium_andersonii.AAC.1
MQGRAPAASECKAVRRCPCTALYSEAGEKARPSFQMALFCPAMLYKYFLPGPPMLVLRPLGLPRPSPEAQGGEAV